MIPILQPSFCAFLDILGFRGEIARAYGEGTEQQLLEKITDALNDSAEDIKLLARKFDGSQTPRVSVKFFTDNVIIGYSEGSWLSNDLSHLIQLVADYQFRMACKDLFIRGAISFGTLAVNESIVLGDALIEAHRLENDVANNPRVIIDPRLKEKINAEISSKKGLGDMWKALLICDVDGHFFVNYLHAAFEPRNDPQHGRVLWPSEEKFMLHRIQVEQHLNNTHSRPEIWSKYLWVATYHNYYCWLLGLKNCKVDESLLKSSPASL